MTVGERERVAAGAAHPLDHPVRPRAHLVGLLAIRAPVAPQVPIGSRLADLRRGQALVVAVVPFAQVLARSRPGRRSRPARTSRAPGAAGCVSTSEKSHPREHRRRAPRRARARSRSAAGRCGWCAGRSGSTRSRRGEPERSPRPNPHPANAARRRLRRRRRRRPRREIISRACVLVQRRVRMLGSPCAFAPAASSSSSVAADSGSPQMLHSMTRLVMTRSLPRGLSRGSVGR